MAPTKIAFWQPSRGTTGGWEFPGSTLATIPTPTNARIAKTAPGAPLSKVNSKLWVGPYGGTKFTQASSPLSSDGKWVAAMPGGHGAAARYEDDPADRGPEHYRKEFLRPVSIRTYPNQVFRECVFRAMPIGTAISARAVAVAGHSTLPNGGSGGATFIDCLFEPPGEGTWNPWTHAIAGGDINLFRCEIKGWTDGISISGAQLTWDIQWCWVHEGYWSNDPAGPLNTDGQTHNDAIQFHRGLNHVVKNNYLGGVRNYSIPNNGDDYNNAGIMLKQEGSTSTADKLLNVTIDRNYIEGGGSGINIMPDKGNDGSTWSVTNNRFIRRTGAGNYIINNKLGPYYSGNIYDDTEANIPVLGQPSA